MKPLLVVLVLLTAGPLVPLRAALQEEVAAASASLVSGHPAEALSAYGKLLAAQQSAGSSSPELWYDRGLAEKNAGMNAAASLSFRRALLLDPTLAPARRELAASLAALGLPPVSGWREGVASRIHPEALILGGSILGWIGVLVLVVLLFRLSRSKLAVALALTAVLFGHGSAVLGGMVDPRRTARDLAVVTAATAPLLRATPADSGTPAGPLTPGSLISVLSRNGAWWYVSGGPGQTGWIPANTATPLLPVLPGLSAPAPAKGG